jgi:hypothetical protein
MIRLQKQINAEQQKRSIPSSHPVKTKSKTTLPKTLSQGIVNLVMLKPAFASTINQVVPPC